MLGELNAERHSKQKQTKQFLEEACALIELSNIVEKYRLGHTKLWEDFLRDCKDEARDRTQRNAETRRGRVDEGGLALRRRKEIRRNTNHQHRSTFNNSIASYSLRNSNELKSRTSTSKKLPRSQFKSLQSKINEEIKGMHETTSKHTQKKQALTQSHKKFRSRSDKVIRKILESNFNKADCGRLYSLNDSFKHDALSKTPIIILPKSSLQTWKSISSLSHSLILNNRNMKRDNNKVNGNEPGQSDIAKPSLHLRLNLRVKPDLNTVDLQIKSSKEPRGTSKSDMDTLSLRLPLQFASCTNLQQTNKKILNKLSTNISCTPGTTPSASVQTSNDKVMKNRKPPASAAPYAKTQAVYNVYDVAPTQQPRMVQGIKSHLYFNINIGSQPKKSYTPTDDSLTSSSVPYDSSLYRSRLNLNSGMGSMQHSYSLDRTNQPSVNYSRSDFNSEPSRSGSTRYSDSRKSQSAVCGSCCPGGREETPIPEDLMERYALLFKRTKERIGKRVGITPQEARKMIISPRVFLNKFTEKYNSIANKVEAPKKNVGSCTCSPFIETEQFSIEEEHVDPECSLLERCFGQLLFNNKCVVCSKAKGIGTDHRPLKPYECEPGTCTEKPEGFLACLKKLMCKRKDKGTQKSDDKEKKKLDKKKAKEAKALAKAKKLEKQRKAKEKERARRLKEKKKKERLGKKEIGTSFLTTIFKKPSEDEDRQWLLDGEGKVKKRKEKKNKEEKAGDKPAEGKNDFESKAKRTFAFGRRGYRRLTRRIRERYYRNKKLAEEQKGRFACDFYLMSLRNKPCLWVYYLCPWFYPYCLQLLNAWRQVSDLLLFFVAIIVWSPCILCAEMLKVLACNMCVT